MKYIAAPLIGIGLTSNIQKRAVAVIAAPSTAVATMPLAICSDATGVSPQPVGPCGGDGTVLKTIPDLNQRAQQNSCFTGLDQIHGASDERSELPAQCGGTHVSTISAGQLISLDNGAQHSVYAAIQNCVATGVYRYTLPVISTCSCSGTSLPVLGFVEIEIDSTSQFTDNGANEVIHRAKQICSTQLGGAGVSIAAGAFGAQEARLVQ